MKKILLSLILTTSVFAGDIPLDTVAPQTTDSQNDLMVRQAKSLAIISTNAASLVSSNSGMASSLANIATSTAYAKTNLDTLVASGTPIVGTTMGEWSMTPVISTSAYAQYDVIGGAFKMTNIMSIAGASGVIPSVFIKDSGGFSNAITLLIFDAAPAGTYGDKAAPTIGATDWSHIKTTISIAASDWIVVKDNATLKTMAPVANVGRWLQAVTVRDLWIVPIAQAAVTHAATNDLTFTVKMDQNPL